MGTFLEEVVLELKSLVVSNLMTTLTRWWSAALKQDSIGGSDLLFPCVAPIPLSLLLTIGRYTFRLDLSKYSLVYLSKSAGNVN